MAHKAVKDGEYQLNIVGVRRAEKGARQLVYKSCFDDGNNESYANYRPLFWYKNSDKVDYENFYDISHSKCYSEYGLKRTGCAGCPFGRDFEQELEVIKNMNQNYTRLLQQFLRIATNIQESIENFAKR